MGVIRLRNDRNERVAIVCFPKSGSTSLRVACTRYLEPGQFLVRDEEGLIVEKLPGWTLRAPWTGEPERVVAVYRNPYARLASRWHEKDVAWKHERKAARKERRRIEKRRPPVFRTWVKQQMSLMPEGHALPVMGYSQESYIKGEGDILRVSWEHDDVWAAASDFLGIDLIPTERRRHQWNWRKPYYYDQQFYKSQEILQMVRRLYWQDFELGWDWETPIPDPNYKSKNEGWKLRIPTKSTPWPKRG